MGLAQMGWNPFAPVIGPWPGPSEDLEKEKERSSQRRLEQLAAQVKRREKAEQDTLARYKRLAESAKNKSVQHLLNIIISDEERHRRLWELLGDSLSRYTEWEREDRNRLGGDFGMSREDLLTEIGRLLEIERQEITQDREMQKLTRGIIFEPFIASMEADSRKHIGILEFIDEDVRKRKKIIPRY